ncbi:uncharacterized protein GBIM_05820, partial [Gryllus bimaculatus]
MAAQASTPKGQVLVNKQFNSPIKMYSAENVAEVLNKQTQVLENGAVGKKEEKTHTHTHVDKDEGMEMGRRERKEGKKKPRKGEGVGYSEEEDRLPPAVCAGPLGQLGRAQDAGRGGKAARRRAQRAPLQLAT